MSSRKRNYVNNKDFYEAMKKFKEDRIIDQNARMSSYIGICIQTICTRLASKSNFNGYTYKDEMILDGIQNCISGAPSFDPEKSDNPFAYFTRIAWNAFIRRIKDEKKQNYIKQKNAVNNYFFNMSEEDGVDMNLYYKSNEASDFVISDFEAGMVKKPKKEVLPKKNKSDIIGVEKFIEEPAND